MLALSNKASSVESDVVFLPHWELVCVRYATRQPGIVWSGIFIVSVGYFPQVTAIMCISQEKVDSL